MVLTVRMDRTTGGVGFYLPQSHLLGSKMAIRANATTSRLKFCRKSLSFSLAAPERVLRLTLIGSANRA